MPTETLTITDNRTGKTYELLLRDGAVQTADLRKIKVSDEDAGLIAYDPGLRNTATCRSSITFVDGEKGVLRYRGYSIEDLAKNATYLEVAYLIFHGELPTSEQYAQWEHQIAANYLVHQKIMNFLDGFRHDPSPMGVLISSVGALSTFFPDAAQIDDAADRRRHAVRLLGQVPTLAAFAHRRRRGMPYAYPNTELSYVGNFLNMIFKITELEYVPDPVIERALDVLFILHADHEQACSTTTMRGVGSAKSDPFAAAAAATAGLSGRFHDEAYEAVLEMLKEIGSKDRVPEFLARVAADRSEPPGFGHRVYRTYDPRARILRDLAEQVFEVTGRPPLFDVALELDAQSSRHPYFVEQKLYPIIDYYEVIIYHAIGFPPELFPVLFAIPRFIGWLAQWDEMLGDSSQRGFRPRQIYTGAPARAWVSRENR